ncbi:hypothetical protein TNCV_3904451 [Trichonephila clavipes]|nr:hypothetical protein TNCV_3904451 [Trichonephila clavipes]
MSKKSTITTAETLSWSLFYLNIRQYQAHAGHLDDEFHESEDIRWMDWTARSPDLIRIKHTTDILRRAIATRKLHPRTIQGQKTELLDECH